MHCVWCVHVSAEVMQMHHQTRTETTAEGAAAAASADPLVLVCVRMHVWCVSAEVMQML